ncbi:hypothetical protein [Herpetosiphon geysericola]|uniref:CRISPR-associated protein n=1 Tax=Herpetosiphon geysericola TaxID=70996 RepID=A0A0P6YN71_9CHLR|nr:hypothetical protein [Herpetosiphon geysericola]KPL91718.1 hypothetical protein SE18_01685 [Herpetosiphon geysericola]
MRRIALCNVGNSDVAVNGVIIRPPRPAGEQHWQTYSEHAFSAPIIDAYARYFEQRQIVLDCVILFDTDQAENPTTSITDRYGVSLRDKDTCWFGKILERYLQERWSHVIRSVERRTIHNVNPSLYDDAMHAFGQQLSAINHQADTYYYVLAAGGTQAFNNALQFKAIARFRENCYVLYKSEHDSAPYSLNIPKQLLDSFNISTAIQLIRQHNFLGAITLLEGSVDKNIIEILWYAKYREDFNFDLAAQIIERIQFHVDGILRDLIRSIQHNAYQINQTDLKFLLVELYYNAQIAYDNGRYADFLGRVFRFQETVLRYVVETSFNISTDYSKAKKAASSTQFTKLLADDPALFEHLEQATIDGNKLDYSHFSVPVLVAMLNFLTKQQAQTYISQRQAGIYIGLREQINKLSNLSEMRNQSVIAHGFEGVSKEQILEKLKLNQDQTPLDLLRTILAKIEISVPPSPFQQIQAVLIEKLYSLI